METYSPRVYFNEKSSGGAPLAGASTSTVLFVGVCATASDELKLTKITNFSEFLANYSSPFGDRSVGEKTLPCYLPYAVNHFFAEGGSVCYVLNLKVGSSVKNFGDADVESIIRSNENVNILCYPDFEGDDSYKTKVVSYCDSINAFAIVDPTSDASHESLQDDFTAGQQGKFWLTTASDRLAAYYPYVTVPALNNEAGGKVNIPPSCVVAGVFSRTDSKRGVHKSPAGIADGSLQSVLGLQKPITEIEHDNFAMVSKDDKLRLNFIRPMIGAGNCVWGARTLTAKSDLDFRYINVSRLAIFLKDSLKSGLTWVTFKPNNQELWGQVERNISAFLRRLWLEGALFGATEEEAYQVIVDDTNNDNDSIARGELNVTVLYAPVRPAEFVVLTFTQKTLSEE